MFGKEKEPEKKITEKLNPDSMKKRPGTANYIITGGVLLMMLIVAAVCIFYKEMICAGGLIFIAIYIFIISPLGQRSSDYRFEFPAEEGLNGFKIFYKNKEVKLNYKLDKYGKFMWGELQRKPDCISYEDESKMDLYLTKYRIMNYINMYMTENGLMSKNAW